MGLFIGLLISAGGDAGCDCARSDVRALAFGCFSSEFSVSVREIDRGRDE